MTLVDLPWCRAGACDSSGRARATMCNGGSLCSTYCSGVGICYDCRFPELALAMRAEGAKAGLALLYSVATSLKCTELSGPILH